MRRSASRRSRTLLLNARPPAMGSPPGRDFAPRVLRSRSIDPNARSAGGQGTVMVRDARRERDVFVPLVSGGDELELTGEPIDDEVMTSGVEPAVYQGRQQQEQAEHEA